MHQVDPTWRYRYYATSLDMVLAISLKIDNGKELDPPHSRQWPNVSVRDEVSRSQVGNESPSLSESAETEENMRSTSSATTSTSSMWSSAKDTCESTLTSPTTISLASPLTSLSPVSPLLQVEDSRCHLCGKVFKGSSSGTNLQRHLRFARVHNKVPTFDCFAQGCSAKFGRSDNRYKHFQTAHSLSPYPQLQRQGAMKRRRASSDELGRQALPVEIV